MVVIFHVLVVVVCGHTKTVSSDRDSFVGWRFSNKDSLSPNMAGVDYDQGPNRKQPKRTDKGIGSQHATTCTNPARTKTEQSCHCEITVPPNMSSKSWKEIQHIKESNNLDGKHTVVSTFVFGNHGCCPSLLPSLPLSPSLSLSLYCCCCVPCLPTNPTVIPTFVLQYSEFFIRDDPSVT